jgi:hypothetical protein
MTKASSLKGRGAVLCAAFAVACIAAAFGAGGVSAQGRTLVGDFCTFNGSAFCMTVTWDGVAYGTPNRAALDLRPGTYWLTVNDTSTMHDFSLRSCPGAGSACDPASGGTAVEITTPMQTGTVTEKILLKAGTYRLFCNVGAGTSFSHEGRGMYVDFAVGGVGQVG